MKHYISTQKIYNRVPNNLWVKCPYCKANLYKKKILPFFECPNCHYDFRLKAVKKIKLYTKQFTPINNDLKVSLKKIRFPKYAEKLMDGKKKTNLNDAILTGIGNIKGFKVAIGILDPYFIMGSMGTIVGDKLVQLFNIATNKNLPVILLISSGGARMQEGILSLIQMIKVSKAVIQHSKKGLFYLSILCDPTMGGVSASFAFQADVILAEPHARIGFAGPKIIKSVSSEKFPKDFQKAEDLMKHGLVDNVIGRSQQLDLIVNLLKIHAKQGYNKYE